MIPGSIRDPRPEGYVLLDFQRGEYEVNSSGAARRDIITRLSVIMNDEDLRAVILFPYDQAHNEWDIYVGPPSAHHLRVDKSNDRVSMLTKMHKHTGQTFDQIKSSAGSLIRQQVYFQQLHPEQEHQWFNAMSLLVLANMLSMYKELDGFSPPAFISTPA